MCLTSVHFMSHFHSSHQNCTAAPSRLPSIQAPGFVFHLQPVVSRSQEFHFISIQPPFQPHTHLKMCVLPPFRSRLTSLHIRRFVSRLHPGCVLPPCRSWELYFSSMGVSSHPHRSLKFCISPPSRSFLNPKQLLKFAPHLYPGPVLLCPDT